MQNSSKLLSCFIIFLLILRYKYSKYNIDEEEKNSRPCLSGLAYTQVSGAYVALRPSEVCGMAFPQVPHHVTARFHMRLQYLREKGARNYLPLSKHGWHIWKPRPWQPARHFLQMTVRAWFSRNLDHWGAGGGAQDARGT